MSDTLHIGTRSLPLARRPWIMGIVNVTPDSFSDGGRFLDPQSALEHALRLVEDGADVLDLGGESSRPGALPVDADEECKRIVPVLRALRSRVEVPISIDTTKAIVARRCLDEGADMINDISALRFDPDLAEVLAGSACGVVLMHMQGEPRTMQKAPHYGDVVAEVRTFLEERASFAEQRGIDRSRLFLDPGIGFGKRLPDNLALLRHLDRLRQVGLPVLVGASRKRFLGQLLDEADASRRLEGDLAINAWAQFLGIDMLRVHEVRAARRLRAVLGAVQNAGDAAPTPDRGT
jgi:dihydropteroate synthase